MFQTLIKAFRLQETTLIFRNYSDNQEFSLKHQERINLITNGTVIVSWEKMLKKRPKLNPVNSTLDLNNTSSKTRYAQN